MTTPDIQTCAAMVTRMTAPGGWAKRVPCGAPVAAIGEPRPASSIKGKKRWVHVSISAVCECGYGKHFHPPTGQTSPVHDFAPTIHEAESDHEAVTGWRFHQ